MISKWIKFRTRHWNYYYFSRDSIFTTKTTVAQSYILYYGGLYFSLDSFLIYLVYNYEYALTIGIDGVFCYFASSNL